jgi:uncharacterized protein (TIGR03437 family)
LRREHPTSSSIFGTNLATGTAVGEPGKSGYPINLLVMKVTFGFSVDAPLLYVSPSQINAVVPAGLAPGTSNVTITVFGETSRSEPVISSSRREIATCQLNDGSQMSPA